MMRHHAFVVEEESEAGIAAALIYLETEFGLKGSANPDIIILRHGLFSVEDARNVQRLVMQGPIAGAHKAVIITASRAYHEAQNALLKMFEEPPIDTTLFFVLPSLGGLLPTLRSRTAILFTKEDVLGEKIPEPARLFLQATREKRGAIAKKLATGKDEEERRENREEAILILSGVESVAYASWKKGDERLVSLLKDIMILRGYLHERSASVRMILEHLALTAPSGLI